MAMTVEQFENLQEGDTFRYAAGIEEWRVVDTSLLPDEIRATALQGAGTRFVREDITRMYPMRLKSQQPTENSVVESETQ